MSAPTLDRAGFLARIELGALLERLAGIDGRHGMWPCPNPAHEQTGATPPASVTPAAEGYGLWRCHGCGSGGTAVDALAVAEGLSVAEAFAALRDDANTPGSPGPDRTKRKHRDPDPLPSLAQISAWGRALDDNPRLLDRLWTVKGWSGGLAALDVGWDGGRLTLPVYDREGALVNLLRYLPGGTPKTIGLGGRSRDLWPSPEVLTDSRVRVAGQRTQFLIELRDVLIVEGEGDAISAASAGLFAIAVPGAEGWRAEWADRFDGMRVRVLTDYDAAGDKLAAAVTRDLAARGACRDLRRIEWPEVLRREPAPGYDLTDYLLEQRAPTERRPGA